MLTGWQIRTSLIGRRYMALTSITMLLGRILRGAILCIGRFLRFDRGSMTTLFAMALPAVLGVMGIAVDFATFNLKQSELQAAADNAALAGAKELGLANSKTSTIQEVARNFVLAQVDAAERKVAVDVKIDDKSDTVTVSLMEQWPPFFAHFLGAEITPIAVSATATLAGRSNICVLALNPSITNAILLQNGSQITAKSCGVFANSKASQAISLKNKSVIKAESTCAVGGIMNKGTITPDATTDCPAIEDPLAGRSGPSVGGCDHLLKIVATGNVSLSPGVYCGGLQISGTAQVTLKPGTYIIKDGPLTVSGTATVTGKDVVFYLTGLGGIIVFLDDATINLSGAEAGPLAGLLIYQDRNAKLGIVHTIRAKKAKNLTGTIYLPNGALLVDPGSKVAEESAYTAIIANTIFVDKGPELVLNANYGATDVPVPGGIRSSAQVVLSR